MELVLPRLAGTRDLVSQLLADQRVPADLHGATVVVLARELASASASFADALVREVVEVRGARELALVGAPDHFVQQVDGAASRRGVAGSVHRRAATDVLA